MNQYINYKRWRLSKLAEDFPIQETSSGVTRANIDAKPYNFTNLEDPEGRFSKTLQDLKYVIGERDRPTVNISPELTPSITYSTVLNDGQPETKHVLNHSGEDLHDLLSSYVGASVFSLLHGTHHENHDNSVSFGIDEIQDMLENNPQDIELSQINNPMYKKDNIEGMDFRVNMATGTPLKYEKPDVTDPAQKVKESVANIVANRAHNLYSQYLKANPGNMSFADYVRSFPSDDSQMDFIADNILLSMLRGDHLRP